MKIRYLLLVGLVVGGGYCRGNNFPKQLVLPYQKAHWQIDLGKNFAQKKCSVIGFLQKSEEVETPAQPFLYQGKNTCFLNYPLTSGHQEKIELLNSNQEILFQIFWLPKDHFQVWRGFQQSLFRCKLPGSIGIEQNLKKPDSPPNFYWHEGPQTANQFFLNAVSVDCFEQQILEKNLIRVDQFNVSRALRLNLKTILEKQLLQWDSQLALGFISLEIPQAQKMIFKIMVSNCDFEKNKQWKNLLSNWWSWIPKEVVCAQDLLSINNEVVLAETNFEELNQAGVDISALLNLRLNINTQLNWQNTSGYHLKNQFDLLGLNVPFVALQNKENTFKVHQEIHFNQLCSSESNSFLGDQSPYVAGGLYRKEVKFQEFGFEVQLKINCRGLGTIQNKWHILLSSPHTRVEDQNASANQKRNFNFEQYNAVGVWHEVARFKGNWENNVQKGVPFLKDIPLIGKLFSMNFQTNQEKTLVLMVRQMVLRL